VSNESEQPKVIGIHEVVVAVKDMNQVVVLCQDLFGLKFDLEWSMPAENMNVKAAMIGETQFQVIEPTGPEGAVARFIKSKGEGLNHVAFRVTNLPKMIARLREKGARLVPEQPVVIGPVSYIFVHPKSTHGGLVELIESKS
jgi:methylmalonyl-CoA/ethylmalonyl-CoA epimerase